MHGRRPCISQSLGCAFSSALCREVGQDQGDNHMTCISSGACQQHIAFPMTCVCVDMWTFFAVRWVSVAQRSSMYSVETTYALHLHDVKQEGETTPTK